jgi:hypothetical protein
MGWAVGLQARISAWLRWDGCIPSSPGIGWWRVSVEARP